MKVIDPLQSEVSEHPAADALIEEARRRQRKRRLFVAAAVLIVAVAAAVWIPSNGGSSKPPSSSTKTPHTKSPATTPGSAKKTPVGVTSQFEPTGVALWSTETGLLVGTMTTTACSSGAKPCPGGRIERTVDGSRTWQVVDRTDLPVTALAVVGTTEAWVSLGGCARTCANTHLLLTDDSGQRWHAVTTTIPVSSISPLSARSAWAVRSSVLSGYDSRSSLVFTADQGRIWQARANPCSLKTTGSPSVVDFATSTRGWVICTWAPAGGLQTKALYETTNGGSSWELRADACPASVPMGSGLHSVGNLSCQGYAPALRILPDGHGWLWTATGTLQYTSDAGARRRAIGNSVVSFDLVVRRSNSLAG
jgi:hypothetical protein